MMQTLAGGRTALIVAVAASPLTRDNVDEGQKVGMLAQLLHDLRVSGLAQLLLEERLNGAANVDLFVLLLLLGGDEVFPFGDEVVENESDEEIDADDGRDEPPHDEVQLRGAVDRLLVRLQENSPVVHHHDVPQRYQRSTKIVEVVRPVVELLVSSAFVLYHVRYHWTVVQNVGLKLWIATGVDGVAEEHHAEDGEEVVDDDDDAGEALEALYDADEDAGDERHGTEVGYDAKETQQHEHVDDAGAVP